MTEAVMRTGIDRAIEAAGGSARHLGEQLVPPVSSQAVCQWKARGWVPPARAVELERLFGIPRVDLVKPELVALLAAGEETPAERYI